MHRSFWSRAGICCPVLCLAVGLIGAAPQAEKKPAQPQDAKQPADESLTPEKYVELGLPAHDRVWLGSDLVKAAKVLAAIAEKNPRQLPRYQSARSGAVFARLNATQNLEMYRDRKYPFDVRMKEALKTTEGFSEITKVYIAAFVKKQVRDSEMTECMGSLFRIAAVMIDLVEEQLPTLNPKDADYKQRMAGLDTMRAGLANVVHGGIGSLAEKDSLRASERVRLIGYMKDTFPKLIPQLTPTTRLEAVNRLQAMNVDEAYRDLQPSLRQLYELVRDLNDKSKKP
jgi:hypothetical protein